MKIALISPYQDIFSIGIRLISAALKKEGYTVKLIFMPRSFLVRYNNRTIKNLIELVWDCKIIGISVMSQSILNVIQITKAIKKKLSSLVIWGGVHPTIKPEECLSFADAVCVGEGEEAIVDLAAKISANLSYHKIPGIWTKTSNREIRPLIQNLDSIPFQDQDNSTHFIAIGTKIKKLTTQLFLQYTKGEYFTMATRGCPHGCSYCCNNAVNKLYPGQKIFRKRSPENLIRELLEVKKKLPISRVFFDDDGFFINKLDDIQNLAKQYKKYINLPLSIGGASPSSLSHEKLKVLTENGLQYIRLGIQSISEPMQKLYGRDQGFNLIKQACSIIEKFPQIRVGYDIILDNPWESKESLNETLLFLTKLKTPFSLILYSLEYYPGTDLHRKAVSEGFIEDTIEKICSSSYLGFRRTWTNKLFILLKNCAFLDIQIRPEFMSAMISKKFIGKLFYIWFTCRSLPYRIKLFKDLFGFALTDLKRLDFTRIFGFVMTRFILPMKRKNFK